MVLEMMMIHYIFILEKIFMKGWDCSANSDCAFHWMGLGFRNAL